MELYDSFLFLHIVFAFMFFFAHGTSLAIAFRLPAEKHPRARAALLAITGITIAPTYGGFIGMAVFGVALGVITPWWREVWWWLSICLMFGVFIWMIWYSRRLYSPIRKALGVAYVNGFADERPATDVSAPEEEIERLIALTRPRLMAWGLALVTVFILYLMVFKPF